MSAFAAARPTELAWHAWSSVDGWRFRWGRDGESFVAEWEGVLRVTADHLGRITAILPAAGADPRAVRKLAEGSAVAFARAAAGKASLHASAVALGGEAIACIGASGSGKSTLAALLCQREGVALLADDIAAVEPVEGRWSVLPTESCHWLEPPSAEGEKAPVDALVPAKASARLRGIVALAFDEQVRTTRSVRLRGAQAFARLYDSPRRFALSAPGWRGELDALSAMGADVPVFELTRSHEVPARATAEALFHLLSGGVAR